MARDPAALQLRLLQTVVEGRGEEQHAGHAGIGELLGSSRNDAAGQMPGGRPRSPTSDADVAEAGVAIEGPPAAGPDAIPRRKRRHTAGAGTGDQGSEITADTEPAGRP
jgi:hypothetical protein